MKGDIETIVEYIARSEGYDDGPALEALKRIRAKIESRQRRVNPIGEDDPWWFGEPERWEDVEILLRAALDEDEAVDAAFCLKERGYLVVSKVPPEEDEALGGTELVA